MKKIGLVFVVVALFFVPLRLTERHEKSCEMMILIGQQSMPLEAYLVGVLNGEMPASFHLEALKAQAIAARTYAVRTTDFGRKPIQSTTAHQVYKAAVDPAFEEKLKQAILETENQIMTYNNEPITAMFHAASNGQTESAENYSGHAINYLKSVPSSEQYVDTKTMTRKQLNQLLQANFQLVDLENAVVKKNTSDRVETITIAGTVFDGRTFREKLALKSTDFQLTVEDDAHIHLTTKGYGHGVGMSQYGANELAHEGKSAQAILQHYYPKTLIEPISCKNDV